MPELESPTFSGETIAAVSTPPGPGGIGVIRISGPEAWDIGTSVFRPDKPFAHNTPSSLRKMILGHAVDPRSNEALDQVLAVFFEGPRSYTTENTVEIQSHSGPAVMARILDAVLTAGARLARPGEFTLRAVLGGRLDLSEAEAVAQLIAARSDAEARMALAGLHGGLARELAPVREALLHAAAQVEAAVDFPDDAPELLGTEVAARVSSEVLPILDRLINHSLKRRVWRQGAVVALVGRPNVGKSTLFNAILGQQRAITSVQPGTTRDAIEEAALISGIVCRLVDTAGLAQTDGEVEGLSQEVTRRTLERADLVVLVLDGSRELTEADHELITETKELDRVVAVNKSDLQSAWSLSGVGGLFGACRVSALLGQGMEELLGLAGEALSGGQSEPAAGEAVASARQGEALARCLSAARRAAGGLSSRDPQPELISLDLSEALAALAEVDGQGAPDEVFDAVFSQFCVGK